MKTFLVTLFSIMLMSQAYASDIPALQSIASPEAASEICEASCQKHECGWSGSWKKGEGDNPDTCDCGPVRIIKIPGGVIRTQAQAIEACNEICNLNEAPWTGEWERVPGAFDVCSCKKVGDWCEPKGE